MSAVTLQLGALCDPISKQLAGNLSKEDAALLDADADAITRCYLMGYIGERESVRARKKLHKKTQDAVLRFHGITPQDIEETRPPTATEGQTQQ